MGGCYSCKSTEPNTHYCTIPMASEGKANKRTTPYCRNLAPGPNSNHNHASASHFGFGFKRKNLVTQSSLPPGDRTGSLVQKYEKITLKNDPKSKNSTLNTDASRFGFRTTNLNNKRILTDANSNVAADVRNENEKRTEKVNNNVKTSQKNAVSMSKSTGELTSIHKTTQDEDLNHQKRTAMLKKQFLGSDFSLKSQSSDVLPKNQTSQRTLQSSRISYHSTSSQNSLNEKSASNKNLNAMAGKACGGSSSLQKPQISGDAQVKSVGKLPRPSQTKYDASSNRKPGQSFITISYKAPSRLTSLNVNLKPKRNNEVAPKSKENSPEISAMRTSADTLPGENTHDEVDCKFANRDSGLGSSLKSSTTSEIQNADNATLSEADQIDPLSSTVASPTDFLANDALDGVFTSPKKKQSPALESSVASNTSSPRIRSLSTRSSSREKESEADDSCSLKFDSKMMKDSINSSKSSERTGAFSPTSDIESRSDFLIDDEIADQPSLMVLNNGGKIQNSTFTVETSSKGGGGVMSKSLSKDDSFANDAQKLFPNVRRSLSLKNSEKKSPSHPNTLAVLAVHRQSMCSTLSSCSSINSDDLMMDFEGDRFNDFEEEEGSKVPRSRTTRLGSTSSTFDELTQLVESHETSVVRQKLATIRHRSRTVSSPDMTQSLTEMPRHRSLSTPLKPPRPLRVLSENESSQGAIKLDSSSHRSLCQDVTNVKTMLFRLKRLLHDADTLNPFEANNYKNSLYQRVANFETPHGLSTCQEEDVEQVNTNAKLTQENTDLRRQVVFLEQQVVDKDRTIKLLQQQMTKYTNNKPSIDKIESCNAATQTTKMRSTTSMDGISPTTVSNSDASRPAEPLPNDSKERTDDVKPKSNLANSNNGPSSSTSVPKRSISAYNIPRAPSTSCISDPSSKSSNTSICSQPEINSNNHSNVDAARPNNAENAARIRSGAFSNPKLESYSNSYLNQDTAGSANNHKTLVKQSKVQELFEKNPSANDSSRTGFSRNSFTRNSGRFLSLFKIKKNQSSSA